MPLGSGSNAPRAGRTRGPPRLQTRSAAVAQRPPMVKAAAAETFEKLSAVARSRKQRFTLDVMLDQTETLYKRTAIKRRVPVILQPAE